MNTCPYCQATEGQVKNGLNPSGTQRWLCRRCRRAYTPEPKPIGYDEATRLEAVQLSVDGMNIRRIGRMLGVNHQSVANWVKAHAAQLPAAPVPPEVETIELDELFTFVEQKKSQPTS
jgi:transposase-like protein